MDEVQVVTGDDIADVMSLIINQLRERYDDPRLALTQLAGALLAAVSDITGAPLSAHVKAAESIAAAYQAMNARRGEP
jgi:hypothetical protein